MSGDISINELLDRLFDAKSKMSVNNKHRPVIVHAMSAIMQLSKRVEAAEAQLPVEKPLVELAQ